MTSAVAAALSAEQKRAYRNDGYLVLRRLYREADVEAVLVEAEQLRHRADLVSPGNLRCRFMPHADTGAELFEVFDPVNDISPGCARMAADPSLLAVLAELYGEEACLFKDKLVYKPPGARGYGIHQDWVAWPGFPRSFVTVLIALDPAESANGCTQVYPGVHRQGCLSPEDGDYHPLTADMMVGAQPVSLEMAQGDVAIFGAFVPHFSGPNRSSGFRRQLFLSYNARSDGGDQRAGHYAEFQRRMRPWREKQGNGHVYFR